MKLRTLKVCLELYLYRVQMNRKYTSKFSPLHNYWLICDVQLRTWKGASDDCCARGGHLITFPDTDIQDLVMKRIGKKETKILFYFSISTLCPGKEPNTFWVGAIKSPNSAGISEPMWCFPGENDAVSYKSPFTAVVYYFGIIIMWVGIGIQRGQ